MPAYTYIQRLPVVVAFKYEGDDAALAAFVAPAKVNNLAKQPVVGDFVMRDEKDRLTVLAAEEFHEKYTRFPA